MYKAILNPSGDVNGDLLTGVGTTEREAKADLKRQIDDPEFWGPMRERGWRKADMADYTRMSLCADDIPAGRWDDNQFFAGSGNSSLRTTEIVLGRKTWHIERRCDAEGNETITVTPASAIQAAANRSYKAGGGVRDLCTDHLTDDDLVVTVSGRQNLYTALEGAE